jgi:hypothetical protein
MAKSKRLSAVGPEAAVRECLLSRRCWGQSGPHPEGLFGARLAAASRLGKPTNRRNEGFPGLPDYPAPNPWGLLGEQSSGH